MILNVVYFCEKCEESAGIVVREMDGRKLFYKLLLEQTKCKKVSEIADEMNISKKSIYNYLGDLEKDLPKYGLKIKKSGDGILITGPVEGRRELLKKLLDESEYSTEERREIIYENFLMNGAVLSINTLSDFYTVSRSSIVNDIKSVEKMLKEQDLFLKRDSSGTFLDGKEVDIREAQNDFIYRKIERDILFNESITIKYAKILLGKYVPQHYIDLAEHMTGYVKEELRFEMNLIYHLQVLIKFVIFLNRVNNRHFLPKEERPSLSTEVYQLRTYPVAQQLCGHVEKECRGLCIPQVEINYVNKIINSVYRLENDVKFVADSENIKEMVIHMIESVNAIFSDALINDNLLINGLERHFTAMLNRISNHVKIVNPYIHQIKKQYAALFSVVSLAYSVIENYSGFTLSEDETGFILIHFQAAVERLNMSRKIIIIVDNIDAYTSILESQIRKNFILFDVIELAELKKVELEYINEFDFAVTTLEVKGIRIPHVQVSAMLTERDLEAINKEYYALSQCVKMKRYTFMLNCLDETIILLQKKYKSMEECVKEVCAILEKDGCIEDGFYDSVISRERIAPTNIVDGIALPHGLNKYVKENRIAIVTLKKPISWGNDRVSTIFLVAINFSNIMVSKKALEELYFCISDEDFISELKSCMDVKEVYQLFETV